MEPIYAVKSTYDEDMFYHQVVASKPRMMPKEGDGKKIKFQLPDFGLKDTLMALLVGAAELHGEHRPAEQAVHRLRD